MGVQQSAVRGSSAKSLLASGLCQASSADAVLIVAYRKGLFSNLAYACWFFFMVLHAIGAHYTY
jgi:hypothetical protein